jgi:hypothetical protein
LQHLTARCPTFQPSPCCFSPPKAWLEEEGGKTECFRVENLYTDQVGSYRAPHTPRAVWASLVGPLRDFLFLFSGFWFLVFFCFFLFFSFLKN